MKEEQQKNEECESCVHCTPELYTVEVDIEFIDKFLEIYKIIKEKLPDEYALGWKELAEEYRLKAIRNKDKITPPHRDKDEVRRRILTRLVCGGCSFYGQNAQVA